MGRLDIHVRGGALVVVWWGDWIYMCQVMSCKYMYIYI